MSLIQKLFSFLIIAIILPLMMIVYLISDDSKQLSEDVTTAIHGLETEFTSDITMAAENLIKSSSQEMDRLTQVNWERLTVEIAGQLAAFLYDRDADLLGLAAHIATAPDPDAVLDAYRKEKTRHVTIPAAFQYDAATDEWQRIDPPSKAEKNQNALNKENQSKFRSTSQDAIQKYPQPLYREISILDLNGQEMFKSSDHQPRLINTRNRAQTFAKAETYGQALDGLKPGEIYVSDVIGTYVPGFMIGPYRADRLQGTNAAFKPEESGYAGLENPLGKRFEGIIRYVTPITKDGEKTGYLTFALDHRHVMEFTDYVVPENDETSARDQHYHFRSDIKNAGKGNYAFMWDHKGRSIAHPREYFIAGFDSTTGERIPPWISRDQAEAFKASGAEDLNDWLAEQPPYQNQSRDLKPNLEQAKSGLIPLDCRYLNFAPQCDGWHQINSTGGYGSFLIYWSNIWKLTTASTIPYYTGQYGKSLKGFGVITIGANIGEFTRSSIAARNDLNNTLGEVNFNFGQNIRNIGYETADVLKKFQNQMILFGVMMIVSVVAVSGFASLKFRARVANLLQKTADLGQGDLSARIDDTSRDEIGRIAKAFNDMAETITQSQNDLSEVNKNLEAIVSQRTDELFQSNQQISDSIDYASRIQRSLLPPKDSITSQFGDHAIIWQPKDVVGGDFYWHKTIGDTDYLVVMDCTGHGVPGAFMTLIATSALEQITSASMASLGRWVLSPTIDDLMQQLHENVCAQLNQVGDGGLSNDGLDATIVALPHDGGALQFCGAQMDLFTISAQGEAKRYRGNRTSLGYAYNGEPLDLTIHEIDQDDGMSFVITTDGITTQIGEEKRRSYGFRRLMEVLEGLTDNSPKQINRAIMRDFRTWQGTEERRDDVTLVSFRPNALKIEG